MEGTFVGIDFSGAQPQWSPNAQASNIWLATLTADGDAMVLLKLQRVQQLPGEGRPFVRLAAWLADGNYRAAAIDAPFSIPWWFFGHNFVDHAGLVAMVDVVPRNPAQDFPNGHAFLTHVATAIPFEFTKPLRVTEAYWRGRGVNIRSTVWNGPRPGAPFTSACIKLLAHVGTPAWPWANHNKQVLVEAFPAAQLRQWELPFERYNGPAGQTNRAAIVSDLIANRGFQAANAELEIIKENADALDAVLCSYGARAVVEGIIAVDVPPFDAWRLEGWIAVHE